MSKITPKNLSYDSTLPPFLQRMQAAQGHNDGRHERAIARPKRARTQADEDDDAPTYVDEGNDVVSRADYEALVRLDGSEDKVEEDKGDAKAKAPGTSSEDAGPKAGEARENRDKEKIATIGVSKKRKTGKVVGGDDDHRDAEPDISAKSSAPTPKQAGDATAPDKKKVRAKKIKLSFNDDEGS